MITPQYERPTEAEPGLVNAPDLRIKHGKDGILDVIRPYERHSPQGAGSRSGRPTDGEETAWARKESTDPSVLGPLQNAPTEYERTRGAYDIAHGYPDFAGQPSHTST